MRSSVPLAAFSWKKLPARRNRVEGAQNNATSQRNHHLQRSPLCRVRRQAARNTTLETSWPTKGALCSAIGMTRSATYCGESAPARNPSSAKLCLTGSCQRSNPARRQADNVAKTKRKVKQTGIPQNYTSVLMHNFWADRNSMISGRSQNHVFKKRGAIPR